MTWWDPTITEEIVIRQKFKIPVWPAPNTNRVDGRFRFTHCLPDASAMAGRWFVRVSPVVDPFQEHYAVVDVEALDNQHLFGESGLDDFDRTLTVDIKQWDPPDTPPNWPMSGTVITFTLTHPTLTHSSYERMYPHPFVAGAPFLQTSLSDVGSPLNGPWEKYLNHVPGATVPFANGTRWHGSTVSQCWDLPGQPMVFGPGAAEFNGVDAYIALDHDTFTHNDNHFLEADIRRLDTLLLPILGRETSGSIWGLDDDEGWYSVQRFNPIVYPAVGTWFKYRQEFEWSSGLQLRYQVFIDDVMVFDATRSRINAFWQNLGVRRRAGPTDWGKFDMKNLKVLRGTPATPIVSLDMPLIENALDLGPDANHGTTFNMDLPSV